LLGEDKKKIDMEWLKECWIYIYNGFSESSFIPLLWRHVCVKTWMVLWSLKM